MIKSIIPPGGICLLLVSSRGSQSQPVAPGDGCSPPVPLGCDSAHPQQSTAAFANGQLFESLTINIAVNMSSRQYILLNVPWI